MSGYHAIEQLPPEVMYEVLAGIERVPQPTPGFAPGGDCYVCSSYAIIRHFALAAGVDLPFSLEDLYRKVWSHKDVGAERGSSFHAMERFWSQWRHILDWWGLSLDVVQDHPISLDNLSHARLMSFGPRLFTAGALVKRLRVYLEAGYVAHVEMQYEAQRARAKRGEGLIGSDHVVVIDGYRELVQHDLDCSGEGYGPHWSGLHLFQLHVVCSASSSAGSYWIDVGDWVDDHGGFSMWFVRPRRGRDVPFPAPKPCPEGHCAAPREEFALAR